MIRIYNILVLIICSAFASLAQSNFEELITVCNRSIQLNELEHNFGNIKRDDKATFKFTLKNLQDESLVIKHVTTSCGCTSPDWTQKPIKKGKTTNIKITYDTSKLGSFNKSIYVYTSFQERPIHLTIKGHVMPLTSEKAEVSKKSFQINGTLPQNQ